MFAALLPVLIKWRVCWRLCKRQRAAVKDQSSNEEGHIEGPGSARGSLHKHVESASAARTSVELMPSGMPTSSQLLDSTGNVQHVAQWLLFLKEMVGPITRKVRMLILTMQALSGWSKSFYLTYPFVLDYGIMAAYHKTMRKLLDIFSLFSLDLPLP